MLELTNIYAGYGRVAVLHDVNLVVPSGSVVALLGANGAGKTTTLKVAAGTLKPNRGSVTIGGAVATNLSPSSRNRAGLCLVPEGRGIFRGLTVRENIAMYARGKKLGDAVDRSVELFPKLTSRLSQTAGTMSGGEQQMLALCRAVISDARIVLADELSVGLAPVIVDEIFEVVARLRDEGRSLLIVEQYVARVLDLADYVYVLHKGKVAFVGVPSQCGNSDLFEQYLGAGAA